MNDGYQLNGDSLNPLIADVCRGGRLRRNLDFRSGWNINHRFFCPLSDFRSARYYARVIRLGGLFATSLGVQKALTLGTLERNVGALRVVDLQGRAVAPDERLITGKS